MRKSLRGLIGLSAVFMTFGCVHLYKLNPDRTAGMDVVLDEGDRWAVYDDATAKIQVKAVHEEANRLTLYVKILNKSTSRFDFVPEDVSVFAVKDGTRTSLKTYSPTSVLRDLASREGTEEFLAGLQNGDAGRKTSVTTTYGQVGDTPVQQVSKTVVNDEAAEQAEADRAAARQEKQRELDQKEYATWKASLLEGTTLMPGNEVGGRVEVDYQDADAFVVDIPAGGKTYEVTMRRGEDL